MDKHDELKKAERELREWVDSTAHRVLDESERLKGDDLSIRVRKLREEEHPEHHSGLPDCNH